MIGVTKDYEVSIRALKEHPDRFFGYHEVDPTRGMKAVRDIRYMKEHFDIKCVTAFPAGCRPQVPINDKMFYPIYAACVDLDLPIGVCCGVPGPRFPMACQDVALIDEVCWYFPELKFIMKHGAEPWTDLAVKLMLIAAPKTRGNAEYFSRITSPVHTPAIKDRDDIRNRSAAGESRIMASNIRGSIQTSACAVAQKPPKTIPL